MCCRFRGIMEPHPHVASIFHITFHRNRRVWIAKWTSVFGAADQWPDWHGAFRSTLALVCAYFFRRILFYPYEKSNVIMLSKCRCCFLTSSLIGTVGATLQIPLSMLFDVTVKEKSFSASFYLGTIPICGSLVFVGYLMKNDDSDPLLRIVRIIYRKMCNCRRVNVVRWVNILAQLECSF